MGWEIVTLLEERGWFRFAHDAESAIRGLLDDDSLRLSIAALSAAEFSLGIFFDEPSLRITSGLERALPIYVYEPTGSLGVAKSDCTITGGCFEAPPRESVPLWDVTVFSADVCKLRAAGVPESVAAFDAAPMVRTLETAHYRPGGYARAIADSGLLRLQGLLWHLKLSVLTGHDVEDALDSYVREMEMGQFTGGVVR